MLLLPMGDGLYNVVQPISHGNRFTHEPWVVQHFYSPWVMDCTTLYNPWVMGTGLPMGHGLYNALVSYPFPMTHGLYNTLVSYLFPMTHGLYNAFTPHG